MALYGELRAMGIACPWEGSDDEIIDAWIDARLEYLDPETGLIDCSGLGGYLWYSPGPDNTISQYVSSGFLDVFSGTGTISFTEKTQPEYLFRTLLPQCVSIMARLP